MFGFLKDVADVIESSLEVSSSIIRTVTKPVAELSKKIEEEVKEIIK